MAIELANEYTNVSEIKPVQPKRREEQVKGASKLRMGNTAVSQEMEFSTADEMRKALWQDTNAQLEQYRFPDQKDFKDQGKQTGKGLWSNDLVRMVLKLNPKLFVEDSISQPGNASFYWVRDKKKTYTGSNFPKGFLTEFTVIKVDHENLPKQPVYGWRTVLLRLVKCGALEYRQIEEIWGEVHYQDHRGKHWAANMKDFRA